MIGAVHACIGAAVGRAVGSRGKAFAAGVATHLIGDLLPHKDFPIQIEAPLLAVTLGVIAVRCGVNSPEVAGAVGGFVPDVENAAGIVGILPWDKVRFPTHRERGRYHGRRTKTVWPQMIGAALCLAYALRDSDRPRR